eukprot:m.12711 g.12711  ORF g.12711 m.12711 type:complete len:205 (+) comp8179_c0_seq2:11-625(+)
MMWLLLLLPLFASSSAWFSGSRQEPCTPSWSLELYQSFVTRFETKVLKATQQQDFLGAFDASVSLAHDADFMWRPYVCNRDTGKYYVQYIDDWEDSIDENTKTQGFDWSLRLGVYQYQLKFLRDYIQNETLRHHVMSSDFHVHPQCYNPITTYNKSTIPELRDVLSRKSTIARQNFTADLNTNQRTHLAGMQKALSKGEYPRDQ